MCSMHRLRVKLLERARNFQNIDQGSTGDWRVAIRKGFRKTSTTFVQHKTLTTFINSRVYT